MYIHVYIHVYICTYIYTYIYVHICICRYTYMIYKRLLEILESLYLVIYLCKYICTLSMLVYTTWMNVGVRV